MDECNHQEKPSKLPKLSMREMSPMEMSEDNIKSFLAYLDSTILRSNLLSKINQDDNKSLINVIYDRNNDISVLASICYGLLNNQKKQVKDIEILQSRIDNLNENEKELMKYQIFYEQYLKNQSTTNSSKFGGLKQKVEEIDNKNNVLLNEMLQLSQSRESVEIYEKTLVDKIINEFQQKRQETISTTNQLSHLIIEFQKQQNEISQLILENIDIKTKYLKKREKIKRLKRKMNKNDNQSTDMRKKNFNEEPRDEDKSFYRDDIILPDSISTFDPLKNNSPISKSKYLPSLFSNSGSEDSKNQYKIPNLNKPYPTIKMAQNSYLMKRWKELSNVSSTEGLNEIIKPDVEVSQGNMINLIKMDKKNENAKNISINNSSHGTSNNTSSGSHVKNDTDIITPQYMKLKHIHNIKNVNNTLNRFGYIPSDAQVHTIQSSTKKEEEKEESSILSTFKKFFSS